jgi:rhodanese-related sulfurtransferase
MLRDLGLDARALKGGFNEWVAAGRPVAKGR